MKYIFEVQYSPKQSSNFRGVEAMIFYLFFKVKIKAVTNVLLE
jgi:hypothetical protein